jgi:hypothetical protein
MVSLEPLGPEPAIFEKKNFPKETNGQITGEKVYDFNAFLW